MICDNCSDRETCAKRKLGGKHIDACVMYFPELRQTGYQNLRGPADPVRRPATAKEGTP